MGDNRNANRNRGYLDSVPYRNTPDRQRNAPSPSLGIHLSKIPWEPFLGVAFAVVGIVILSVAVTMLTNSSHSPQDNTSLTPAYTAENNRDALSTDELAVTSQTQAYVEKADFTGKWQKTDVYETEKATLTVTDQDELSFQFTLKLWNGKKTASLSGQANFTGADSAAYLQGNGVIYFQRGTQYMTVYHSGDNADFGIAAGFHPDGKYTDGTPDYYTKQDTNGYDYHVYQSDAVVKSLSSTLSKDDYALYQEMMRDGLQSPIAYERKVDKNGNQVNVDAELDCVKYYAHLNAIGKDMIFICSESGKIYVLFYDVEEIRYYTNDKSYSAKMPQAFQAVANAKGITPVMIYR